MKNFQYYLEKKEVRKVSPDFSLAVSLKKDAVDRATKALKLGTKEFSKFIFENLYDAVREICDAILALDGFKSYSHEASISYLRNFAIDESVILAFDNFRYKRNGSKYYGREILINEAEDIKIFYKENFEKLINILNKKIKQT